MEDRLEDHTKEGCASCVHKSRIKCESDTSATWCLKMMLHIDYPQFACMFHQEQEIRKDKAAGNK